MKFNELVDEVAEQLGSDFTKRDVRDVLTATASAVQKNVLAGEDVSIPKLVRIGFGYRPARKKGDVVAGFGGEERTVEKNEPEVVRISVGVPGGKKALMPAKGSKAYKAVVARKKR